MLKIRFMVSSEHVFNDWITKISPIKRMFSYVHKVSDRNCWFSRSSGQMQCSQLVESVEILLIDNRPAQFLPATSVFRDRKFDLLKQCVLYCETDDTDFSGAWIQRRKQVTIVGGNDLWLKRGLSGSFLDFQTAKFRFDDICTLCIVSTALYYFSVLTQHPANTNRLGKPLGSEIRKDLTPEFW